VFKSPQAHRSHNGPFVQWQDAAPSTRSREFDSPKGRHAGICHRSQEPLVALRAAGGRGSQAVCKRSQNPAAFTNPHVRMVNRSGDRGRFENGTYFQSMGIETSAIRQQGRLTGRGAGDAWKAFGTHSRVSIVRSVFRHQESQPDGRPAPVRSGQAPQGVGIETSTFRQFACNRAPPRNRCPAVMPRRSQLLARDRKHTGSANKDALVPSPRRKRGPCGARGSIPSTSHHANVAQ
jgi:hypothetical protein